MQIQYQGRLLLVDDDLQTCAFWKIAMQEAGYVVDIAHALNEMRDMVLRHGIDVVLVDMNLGSEHGLDALPFLVSRSPHSKIYMLTAHASIETAVSSLQIGASGYITKDTDPKVLAEMIGKDLLQQERMRAQPKDDEFASLGFIGCSKAYHELCERMKQLKNVDSTLMLTGESGTGKEVVARVLHQISNRSKGRFEAINCAAIPDTLLESELFGHTRGAFTDARTDRKGIFELCSNGTLLLDEIGDMPLALQAKVLRVLQDKVVTPIGSSAPIKVDTRIIVATHRDLQEEIVAGRFREDLYYRVSVIPFHLPPLRHRKADIPVLVETFVEEFNKRFKKHVQKPTESVMKRLVGYDWPGNVRELRNVIERAIVLADDDQLRLENLFQHLHSSQHKQDAATEKATESLPSGVNWDLFNIPLTEAKNAFEKIYLQCQLTDTLGNISETAKRTGRYRADIYRLLERYDLQVENFR